MESCWERYYDAKEIVTGSTHVPATRERVAYTRSMAAMATISKCKINLNVGTRLQNRKLYKANML